MKLAVAPEIVQTEALEASIVMITGSCDSPPVAVTGYEVPPTVADVGAVDVNLISCVFLTTSNDCCSCRAGANSPFPAWFASIVHVPAPTKLTVVPETVHTEGVPEEKDNARPEAAAAGAG